MDSNSTSTFTDEEKIYIGITCSIVGIIGAISHALSMHKLYQLFDAHNPFILLCILNGFISIGLTLIFSIWLGPITILFPNGINNDYLEHKVGQSMCFLYYNTLYIHTAKCLNRFFAISRPVVYRNLFTNRKTMAIIFCIPIIVCFHNFPQFFGDCYIYFDFTDLSWKWPSTDCGNILGTYIDFIYCSVLMFGVFLFDLITIYYVKQRFKNRHNITVNEKQKLKVDVGFFIQTFIIDVLEQVQIINFNFTFQLFNTKWGYLGTTTFTWECFHMADGIIMLYFATRWYRRRMRHLNGNVSQSNSVPKHAHKAWSSTRAIFTVRAVKIAAR